MTIKVRSVTIKVRSGHKSIFQVTDKMPIWQIDLTKNKLVFLAGIVVKGGGGGQEEDQHQVGRLGRRKRASSCKTR